MVRGETIYDHIAGGKPPDVDAFLKLWDPDLTDKLLGYVWEAYDRLYTGFFPIIDWTQDYDDLERSITEELELTIRKVMYAATGGYSPVEIQHAPAERESMQKAPAQPPTYDIAFVWLADKRVRWPLEAKVLKSDANTGTNLRDYTKTINERFLNSAFAQI